MLRACIYIQVAENDISEAGPGEHSPDGVLYNCGRPVCEQFLGGAETLSSRITGMTGIHLVCELFAGETNLVGVDDDDIVTAVNVGSVVGLVFAAKYDSNA